MKIINLLPRHKQQELRYEDLFHSVFRACGVAVLILLAVLIAQIGEKFYLNYSAQNFVTETESIRKATNKSENTQLKETIKLSNAQMTDYKTLTDTVPNWAHVLADFASQVPPGVTINGFSASMETKKIMITGQSPTREAVIQMYTNINGDTANFKDIDYPLENVAKPTDVTFHYSFTVKDEALK